MLRPGAKTRRKGGRPSSTAAPDASSAKMNEEKSRENRLRRFVPRWIVYWCRPRFRNVFSSKPVRKCVWISVVTAAFLLVLTRLEVSGHLVDYLVYKVVYLLGHLPQPPILASNYAGEWPTVEMRNRKSIQNYRNDYLEAVLSESVSPLNGITILDQLVATSKVSIVGTASMDDGTTWWGENALQARLKKANCNSRWLCQRCLAFPLAGSFGQCQFVCPPCYLYQVEATKKISFTSLSVKWTGNDKDHVTSERSIPRIIHNIGRFEEMPTVLSHPEWIRAQNAWRLQTGYEYHAFPTMRQHRRWIQQNYPSVFLAAFDYLQGDERQTQLFALLLLFQSGGIVAYMDLMLEGQLDTILSGEGLSFAAAIRPAADAVQCSLYDGLIAARPGHPVIGYAIETLIYFVAVEQQSSRNDVEELYAYLSRYFAPTSLETWKIMWMTRLCPLSVAMHRVLKHDSPYERLGLGPVALNDGERALLWIMSENDTGATRISEVGRNLLVASTDLRGWSADSVDNRSPKNIRQLSNRKPEKKSSNKRIFPLEFSDLSDSSVV